MMLALRLVAAALLLTTIGCGSTTRRITSGPPPAYPPGVGGPVEASIIYPPGTPLKFALRDYLDRGANRGAGWVSHLEFTSVAEPPCSVNLLPSTVQQQYDATYLTTGRDFQGDKEYEVKTRREQVMVPFVRSLDDLDSVVRDAELWTSSHPPNCSLSKLAAFEIRAFIHGRVPLGVRPGPGHLDLRRCSRSGLNVVRLGSPDAIAPASAVLPDWVGSRVRLELADGNVIEGKLQRYYLGNITVENDDGRVERIHVVDAVRITRMSATATERQGNEPNTPECDRWRSERQSF